MKNLLFALLIIFSVIGCKQKTQETARVLIICGGTDTTIIDDYDFIPVKESPNRSYYRSDIDSAVFTKEMTIIYQSCKGHYRTDKTRFYRYIHGVSNDTVVIDSWGAGSEKGYYTTKGETTTIHKIYHKSFPFFSTPRKEKKRVEKAASLTPKAENNLNIKYQVYSGPYFDSIPEISIVDTFKLGDLTQHLNIRSRYQIQYDTCKASLLIKINDSDSKWIEGHAVRSNADNLILFSVEYLDAQFRPLPDSANLIMARFHNPINTSTIKN